MSKEKVTRFIDDNNINLHNTDSALNSDCTILAGWALYECIELDDLLEYLKDELTAQSSKELQRVYEYAKDKGYGMFWITEQARNLYVF